MNTNEPETEQTKLRKFQLVATYDNGPGELSDIFSIIMDGNDGEDAISKAWHTTCRIVGSGSSRTTSQTATRTAGDSIPALQFGHFQRFITARMLIY